MVSIFMYDANDQRIASSMTANMSLDKPNAIFVYGGANNVLGGVYIDDVAFTPVPEPATLTLLGLGGALALVRRNRK